MRTFSWLVAALVLLVTASSARADTHIVEMLNADPDDPSVAMVFEPPVLRIAPGDTVVFKSVDPGHNSISKRGMLPEGAEGWNSPMNEDFEVTLEVEGTYGYICLPHYAMGMVGLILVGDHRINLGEAKKVRHQGSAAKVFRELFARIEASEQAALK
ncbi:MAG: pseudoazurin [Pseudomonadota bacterium]